MITKYEKTGYDHFGVIQVPTLLVYTKCKYLHKY